MIHALAYIAFILPFTWWLGRELKLKPSLATFWKWILAASLTGLAGSAVSHLMDESKAGNFFLHASGGVSAAFLFIYLIKTLELRFRSWLLTAVIVFGWVSALGVMNELAEYFFEFIGFGPYSFDSHDTWRDFVANTSGAAVAWFAYTLVQYAYGQRNGGKRPAKPKTG